MTSASLTACRSFAHRRVLQLTEDEYLAGVRLLAEAAQRRHGPVDALIGVANGGLTPARALGDLFDVPVYRVDARHNATCWPPR